jgi:ATP-dependent RNA helicase DeaD
MMIPSLSEALAERGYDVLTDVQQAVTAPELAAADLLVSAQTGSGKTVGFGLAIAKTLLGEADMLPPAGIPLALVIAPTRELALQVMRELGWLYAKAGARVVSCVGGMDMRDERRALDRGAHIVVGTPGRLRDHIQRGSLDMTGLRAIVLDEADEMLDLGFREDLEFMLGAAPLDRRTLMFSATVPPSIATLARQFQRDAVRVTTLSGKSQHADITYQALRVAQHDAENAIINVLRFHDAQSAIVFANTRLAVSRLTARLANRGFAVVSLSGELSQTERTHALQAMRDGRATVCVATDVAARGIDLPNLDLVIHADLPSNAEGLLHRSGRTGRAGRKGLSALIVPTKQAKKAERLLSFGKITAEWTVPPSAEDVLRRDEERLLNDPAWTEEATEEQSAFAARLLELHSAERIAAAYLRLYQARQSAPEDLSPPDTRPAAKDRKPFGPGVWVRLSVGRDDRAEPRWLLPLLCRAGEFTKDAIGAIRVQQTETFVELDKAEAAGFLAALGTGLSLEKGIQARRMDGPLDSDTPAVAAPPPSAPPARPLPSPAAPPPAAHPVRAEPQQAAAKQPIAKWAPDLAPATVPASAAVAPTSPARDKPAGRTKPRKGATAAEAGPAKQAKPARPPRRDAAQAETRHPAAPGKGPYPARADSPGKKPAGRTKPRKPGPPAEGGPGPARKGSAKSSAGPAGPAPATTRSGAADTSKRFVRPGTAAGTPGTAAGGKPKPKPTGARPGRGKPPRDGGQQPPRRRDR